MDEDQILALLEGSSDVDDGDNFDDEDIMYDVPYVQTQDRDAAEREATSGDNIGENECAELEIPTILDLNDIENPSTNVPPLPIEHLTTKQNIKWRRVRKQDVPEPEIFIATETDEVLNIGTPYSYFQKYLPNEFFAKTTHYTNRYAQIQGQLEFKECTVDEIRVVFAHHIMMGVLKFPRVEMYYNSAIGITFFTENITRKRFFAIRNRLHLVDVSARVRGCTDRLFKVRPIIDQVRNRLLQLPLEENLCIDEQIIPYKGKFTAKQYIKGKPCPWGIKVFFLCGKSGIPYDLMVYQGSTTPINEGWVKTIGFGSAVVLQLTQRIPRNKVGHKLFFDNYFPSYQLFEMLKKNKIDAAGTIRVNRFANPPLPSMKEMKIKGRGSSAECISCDGNVILTSWYDNKVVNLGSNFIGVGVVDKANRWDKLKNDYVAIDRPQVVRMYNESMGGVDLLDQMIQYYRINIRTRKWTLRVIMHFVDLSLTAAWMEYRRDSMTKGIPKNKILDSMNFRIQVAKTLLAVQQDKPQQQDTPRQRGRPKKDETRTNVRNSIDEFVVHGTDADCIEPNTEPLLKRKKIIQSAPPLEVRFDKKNHLPSFIEAESAGRCKAENCTKKTFIICKKCQVYLCVKRNNNCFEGFHTKN